MLRLNACPRCQGTQELNPDGDWQCFQCGAIVYSPLAPSHDLDLPSPDFPKLQKTTRLCRMCGQVKVLAEFSGRSGYCKSCMRIYRRERSARLLALQNS